VLDDLEGAIRRRIHDGISHVTEIGDVFPIEQAVAAGALGPAFDNVSGHDAGRELVPVVPAPAELVAQGCHGERGIRGAAGDHDLGTVA
jgi:hypothetical protein